MGELLYLGGLQGNIGYWLVVFYSFKDFQLYKLG